MESHLSGAYCKTDRIESIQTIHETFGNSLNIAVIG